MSRSHIQVLVACLILPIVIPAVRAVEFGGGTGTADDPYQIATAEQLISISSDPNLLDKHFVMVNDIDLDPNISSDYVFDRAVINRISGVFDGNGFCIRHLMIRGPAEEVNNDSLGLIGSIAENGKVKRLFLESVSIISEARSGGVGAMCAANAGTISQCSVSGIVRSGDVAGGIAGWNGLGSTVEESSSICDVSARISGGLVAVNKGNIRNCSASGRVSGVAGWLAGGLVGRHSAGLISNCYATCQVDGADPHFGGLVGFRDSSLVIRASYFLDPCDGGGPDNGLGIPLTNAQMRQVSNFIGWEFWETDGDGSRALWLMPEGGYPRLAWSVLEEIPIAKGLSIEQAHQAIEEAGFRVGRVLYDYDRAVTYDHAIATLPYRAAPAGTPIDIVLSLGPYNWLANPGKGEPKNPYLICSAGQLDSLAYEPELWNRHFKLVGDLIMTGRVYDRSLIGRVEPLREPFSGVFDGNGHIIKGLTIAPDLLDEYATRRLGLFGETMRSASIKDLGLKHVFITGTGYPVGTGGMLCALNRGYIGRCYSLGVLQWYDRLGGLVGWNEGTIEDCYAGGTVEDTFYGTSNGSYAGLVASNVRGTISTCYATCSVPAADGAGLVASNVGGMIEHSLWDVETSNADTSAGGTGLGTRELMDVTVLQDHGWGGNPNWIVDDGMDYPRLIWEGTAGSPIPSPAQ